MVFPQAIHCVHSSHITWEETSSIVEASSALHSSGPSLSGADSKCYMPICSVSGDLEVFEVLLQMCSFAINTTPRALGTQIWDRADTLDLLFACFTVNGNLWVLIIMPHRGNTTGIHFNKEIHLFLYLGPYLSSFLSKWSVPEASLNV